MNRQEFRKELEDVLENTLPVALENHVDCLQEVRAQTVRYLLALDTKYGDSEQLQQKLTSVLDIIEKEINEYTEQNLISVFEKELDRLSERFPELVEWEQSEERFTARPDDSAVVVIGKKSKSISRTIGRGWYKMKSSVSSIFGGEPEPYTEWKQVVLPKNIVKFHLLDEEMVLRWLHSIKRQQLQMITSIENYLMSLTGNSDTTSVDADLKKLAKSLDEQSGAYISDIKGEIRDALKGKEVEILEKVEKTGTFERRTAKYRDNKVSTKQANVFGELEKEEKDWENALKELQERSLVITEFLELQEGVNQKCSGFLDKQADYFSDLIQQPLEELRQKLEKKIESPSLSGFSELKDEMHVFFDTELISPIRNSITQDVFSRRIEHFSEQLLNQANAVSEKHRLLTKFDLNDNPPRIASREVEWRLLVIRSIRENILNPVEPFGEQFAKLMAEMLNELQETAQAVEINLESAGSLKDNPEIEEGESPEAIAREGLQRALSNIEQLEKRLHTRLQDFDLAVRDGEKAFSKLLISLIYEGDMQQLQMMNAKYRARETTRDWKTRLASRLAAVQDKISVWIRFGGKKVKEWYNGIGTFLGFREKRLEEVKRADIATYLTETDQKLKELPYIYRQLFNFDGTADSRFYVPISDATSTLKKAFGQWNNSFSVSLALVGEKGSGKSSFLDHVPEEEIGASEHHQISMEETISSEKELVDLIAPKLGISGCDTVMQMVSEINSRDNRMVVELEDIQQCYVRNINGYEAIEKLCYLISETRDKVFWIISCSRYAWQFLDKAVQLSEYFSYVTVCDDLEPDEIRKVILSRHRASGYSLHFETDDDIRKSRSYRKLMDEDEKKQEYLQDLFFKKLTELAEGNASVAMIFWIRSIKEFDDTHCYIRPLEVTSLDMIEDLSPKILFSLAAFVLHDTLSDKQFASILNLDSEESRLMLNRLQGRGLLQKKGDVYSINHLMYRQIVRVLKERNIIHLV